MPSTRRVKIREKWPKRARHSPAVETEPQDLRVVRRQLIMEQNAETNGCEDGPVALAVSNHTDSTQNNKIERQVVKALSNQESRITRHTSGGSMSGRARRNTPAVTSHPIPISPSSERRATRHLPSLPVQASPPVATGERRSLKNSHPIPATHIQSNKKTSSHPPNLSAQVAHLPVSVNASLPSHETTTTTTANAKHAKHSPSHSSPPLSSSQKRHLKSTAASLESDLSSPRASKRIRLQHQPFQSPPPPSIIPAILRHHTVKTPEDKIVVFNKGEFLAVRNENGSFFVCRTAQNVYKSSKRFKIQWMSDKEPNMYIPDFYDQTDFECVLTNLRLKRIDKNKYMLPSDERQRTLNILQRALNVENGMDIPDLHQVTTDGVDVSIVGKEEEEVLRKQQQTLKTEQRSRIAQLRNRGRPRKIEVQQPQKITRSATEAALKKPKTLSARVKLRSRETVKVKLKKEGGRIMVTNRMGKPVPKLQKIVERLHPNPKVAVFEKDPTFELNIPIPYVSSAAHSKLLIRAVLLKDIKMLQSLINDTQKICSLDVFRSVDVQLTPLMYATLEEDHRAIRTLLTVNKKKYANPPETLLEHQGTGRYNMAMLGHMVKPINVSRGGREGNNAFLKDLSYYDTTYPSVETNVIKEALRVGVSFDTLNLLCAEKKAEKNVYSWEKDEVLKHIVIALRNGHRKLAGQLVSEAADRGGYGFGTLHKEVLTKDRQPLSSFKPVSVTKKAIGNARVTPLHCSAINPNPQYLASLLGIAPDYSLPDENGWRPIHYASVCKTTGPLELLLSRGISVEDGDSEANTALHVACTAGRAHNVDLILRHYAASDHGKKEVNSAVTVQDKHGVAGIDRGNKKCFTPLHLACQYGHTDVVRVLLRHKATVDKATNAQHDKLTPLMISAQKGHLSIVSLLIDNTARVEAKDKKQRTALAHAVINGHAHVTSYLLRLGANPNSTDSSGNTLVHYAAAYGWYFCMKLLIEAGASLNLPNDWKITPLSLAFMKGHMGLVDFLVEQPGIDINVDINNESGMTLVMQALRPNINHSMLERIHFLVVKQNCDCTKVDFMGNNTLHHLVLSEVQEIQNELKKMDDHERESIQGCDAIIDDDNYAVKIKAKPKEEQLFKEEAQQEHDALIQEITKLLLDHSCDPMARNKEGESPFTLAVKEGCLLLVKMFLDAGCQLSLDVSQSGDTILHYLVSHACNRKVEPMLQAILNAKCSNSESTPHQLLCQMVKMYNKKGHTPLLQALHTLSKHCDEEGKNRLLTFAKFLVDELGADVSAPCKDLEGKEISYALHLATCCAGGRVTELLLSHKAPLNSLDCNGQTPLVLAIIKENVEAIEALVKAGATVNLKSKKNGNLSPLLLSSKNRRLGKIVQLLVHNKADVNEIDPKNKNTALHYIVSIRAPDALETAKTLLTAGANVNCVNDHQRTPLHMAVNASSSDSDASYAVEECLLGFGAKVDAYDCRGRIPLHYAFVKIGKHRNKSQIDPIEVVVLLTGAMGNLPIDIADNYGQTPLHLAGYRGSTISTMHLAQRMKNLDVRDKNGNTALGLAVRNGHESCALMLLQRGASCIADLILTVEDSKLNADIWEWKHVQKEIPTPGKHTVLQETLIKDWQGILFLMLDQLEAMGKGINIAVEAALRTAKYNVALKLIGRIKHGWTLYTDKQSMLHVLAREAPPNNLSDLQVKVAQFLIEKGVPAMARDEHGGSVLTYAAMNWNYTLCSFFSGKMGMAAAAQVDRDKSNRTPLTALFWKLNEDDLPEDMRNWCISLLKAGATPDFLTNYPIKDSPFSGVRCTTLKSVYIEDPSATKLSPLIMAIYKENYAIVKLLLSNGADVNFPDDHLRTPLMYAARLNDIKMVKLLLNYTYDPVKDKNPYADTDHGSFQKTSAVEMTKQDADGWTVVHHLVSPLPDYCYHNTTLLYLLAEMGAPLETSNTAGETPLQMALRLKREPVVKAFQELLNIPEDKRDKVEPFGPLPVTDGIHWEQAMWDYKDDSKSLLSKLEAENMGTIDDKMLFKPDPLSGFEELGEVIFDSEKNIPYDVVMTAVDLNYGAYGIYNFYKMQLIKQKHKDLIVVFTCWGRVGDTGQYQKTPFGNLQDGTKEFCRIFRAKSGNNWDDVQNFQPQPKKYRLVQLEKRRKVNKNQIKLNLKSDLPSKLSKPLQNVMEDLMDVHNLEGSVNDLGVNSSFEVLPFGSLTEETLKSAEDLLKEIGNVIVEKDNIEHTAKSQEKYAELMHRIIKLSEEFYQLIPVYGYQYERLWPLFSAPDVHAKMVLIHNLLHIGIAGKMLLGASEKITEINPKDYVYRSLGCQLQLLERESQEAQMILQYIHVTASYSKPKVEGIYRVYRQGETEALKEVGLSNHFLLWHGTSTSNLLSILCRGLQVTPLGVQRSGSLFGKGIYLADMFGKSEGYCVSYCDSDVNYMLLCEAALGDVKEIDCNIVLDPADQPDSVKALGRQQPDPATWVSWQGVTVPLGEPVDTLDQSNSDSFQHRLLSFNEYVVYKPSQVCIRYLIQFKK